MIFGSPERCVDKLAKVAGNHGARTDRFRRTAVASALVGGSLHERVLARRADLVEMGLEAFDDPPAAALHVRAMRLDVGRAGLGGGGSLDQQGPARFGQ